MTKYSPIKPDKSILSKARPAVYLFRSAACHLYAGAAAASGRENLTPTGAAQRLFGGDVITEGFVRRGISAPATTGDTGWAGALVTESVFDAVQTATSLSAGASLISSGLKVSLAGVGQVLVPGRVVSIDAAGQWVREGLAIPVRAPAFTAVILARRKLAVVAVFTREMAESSNIEAIVRQMLSEASAAALDAAMFSTAADDGARPAGLLNGVVPLAPTAGSGSAAMAADIGKLVAALAANGGGLNPTIVAAAPQATALKLLASPKFDARVLASAALPSGTVVAIEASSFVSGFDSTPEFNVSRAGTLHMEGATPAPVDGATPVRDLYQTDCLALKMTLAASWAIRAPHVGWIQNTSW